MEWLENLRKMKNNTSETYKSISEKTNIPQTTIEKLFNGRTKDPKLFMIREVVHCLGYTLDDLLEDENVVSFSPEEKRLLEKYRVLNKKGSIKVNEYIEDLAVNPEYTVGEITVDEIQRAIDERNKAAENELQIAAHGGDGVRVMKLEDFSDDMIDELIKDNERRHQK